MGFGVPKAISLASGLVSDEDHRDRLGVKFLPFVVVDPGSASEDAEVGNVRDAVAHKNNLSDICTSHNNIQSPEPGREWKIREVR